MAQFGTRTDVLAQAAAHVERVNGEIQARLTSLAGSVAETSGFWRGESQRTFAGLMDRWQADARRLTEALGGISATIGQSASAYAAAEESGTTALRSSGSGLTL
jgi:WXG100 family type VII secretion target